MSIVEATRAPERDRAPVHRAFGVAFGCGFELAGLPVAEQDEPAVEIRLAKAHEIEAAWSGPAAEPAAVDLVQDGLPYRTERGAAGDHRFVYAERAVFHLSADGATLLCAPADPEAPEWRRVLLDSVLTSVSLVHGNEALHAAAVLGPGGIVALMAGTGGGKTTLAAELVRRGLPLVCDDILALTRDEEHAIVGHPAPPVMNLPPAAPAPPGTPLAHIGGETWLAVHGAATAPARVAAICLVDRRPGAEPALVSGPGGPLDLLAHGLRSGSAPQRRQARFDLLADLAAQADAYVLEADTAASSTALADLLESTIPALSRPRVGASR